MGFLQSIIAKGLAIVDDLMSEWATATLVPGTSDVCVYNMVDVELTDCGTQLTDGLAELVHRGVDLLNGLIAALGAY